MSDARVVEIQNNYQYFQTMVATLMSEHSDKFALLHDRRLVQVFARPIDAMNEGFRLFADGLFSVQKVTDKPVDLGFLSHASDNGIIA